MHCRGHDSATITSSGVIICPVREVRARREPTSVRTAVIRRTPSPPFMIRIILRKSISARYNFPERKTSAATISGGQAQNRLSIQGDIASEQSGGRSEAKKNDCGRARTGTPEFPSCGKARQMCPFHARSRFLAGPCFRTGRSGRSPRILAAQSMHKSAGRRPGSATGGVEGHPASNLSFPSAANGEGCHYDRPGRPSQDHPWFFQRQNT